MRIKKSLQQNEEFISFRSFTEYYISDRPECARRLKPYLRRRSERSSRRFLEDLSNEVALEAWRRAAQMSEDRQDDLLIQMGDICADIEQFIQQFHF